jgi:hypothetical protein
MIIIKMDIVSAVEEKRKIVILIISSSDVPEYAEMKRLSHTYYSLFPNDIRFFYIEARDQEEESVEDGNTLYLKGTESVIPGIYLKTMKALQHIQSNYNYDFVLRTNLSSFFNIPHVIQYFQNKPLQRFAGGYPVFWFTSGTCICFSRDVGELLTQTSPGAKHPLKLVVLGGLHPLCEGILPSDQDIQYGDNTHDDVLISRLLDERQITRQGMEPFDVKYFEQGYCKEHVQNLTEDEVNHILFYRCKNENRMDDVRYFQDLLQRIYHC